MGFFIYMNILGFVLLTENVAEGQGFIKLYKEPMPLTLQHL